jgi:hypothetical protein
MAVTLSLYLIMTQGYGSVYAKLHAFLTSTADTVGHQLHAKSVLTPGKATGTHWIEGWMGIRNTSDVMENTKTLYVPIYV